MRRLKFFLWQSKLLGLNELNEESFFKNDLDRALKYYVADLAGVSVLEVKEASLSFDEGWPGTDVTPGEPPEVHVFYKIERRGNSSFKYTPEKLTEFIGELARVASGRNF